MPRVQPHTDESLGDCSFLNTCFHMDTCKYIHYEVDKTDVKLARKRESAGGGGMSVGLLESTKLIPPQWIQCDLRNLNVSVLLPDTCCVLSLDLPLCPVSVGRAGKV